MRKARSAASSLRPSGASRQRIFVTNLGLILLFAVGFFGWFFFYTESFIIVAVLGSLGSVCTALASVLHLLPEDRLKEMRSLIATVLEQNQTSILLASLFLVASIFSGLFLGTIQVESSSRVSSDQDLYMYRVGSKPRNLNVLPAGRYRRTVLWTTWWSPCQYIVKVSGYPDRLVTLLPLSRIDLRFPSSFQRPVVLIRPSGSLWSSIRYNPSKLVVTVNRRTGTKTWTVDNYIGQAFWIGCDEDIEIPQSLQNSWKREFTDSYKVTDLPDDWLRPETLGDARIELTGGEIVQAEILSTDGHQLAKGKVSVRPREGNFVLEMVLETLNPAS
jgi:hypothetical protein